MNWNSIIDSSETIDGKTARELAANPHDKRARHALVMGNLRLVEHWVRRHAHPMVPLSDLRSAGIVGILKAIDTYDPNRGCAFSTHASWQIKKHVLMAISKEMRFRRKHVADDVINDQHVQRTNSRIKMVDAGIDLDELIGCLPHRKRFVVNKRHVEGWSFKQISEALGIGYDGAQWIYHDTMRKIRSRVGINR